MSDTKNRVIDLPRVDKALFGPELRSQTSLLEALLKAQTAQQTAPSKQGVILGIREHEFDFRAVTRFQLSNIHHSTCVRCKVSSMVGLGFVNKKTSKVLNPLCEGSFQDVLNPLAEDYVQTGNAYLEVIREGDKITGLHRIPAEEVRVVIEDINYNRHYIVQSRESAGYRVFAKFGDLEDFNRRRAQTVFVDAGYTVSPDQNRVAEVIHIPRTSALSRFYGWPDWLAAVASIELVQCVKQQTYDFFNNRGVPEFILFVLENMLSDAEWKALNDAVKGSIGLGNSHKSSIVNIGATGVKVQLEKLAIEGKTDGLFSELAGVLAHEIVSAHGVPPLLAGIQIPGKLGATNELPNALVAFQALVIGPAQHQIMQALDATLGNPEINGGLGLVEGDFEFNRITAQVDIAAIDTAARMQDAVASPDGQARMQQVAAGTVQNGSQGGTMNGTAVNLLATTKNGAKPNPYLKKNRDIDFLPEEVSRAIGEMLNKALENAVARENDRITKLLDEQRNKPPEEQVIEYDGKKFKLVPL